MTEGTTAIEGHGYGAPGSSVAVSAIHAVDGDHRDSPREAPGDRAGPGAPSIRVIIVDDEEVIRESLRDLLDDMGYDVVGEAPNGLAGAALAGTLLPEVVVMDLRMPELDGVQATARIHHGFPWISVVVMSAYDDPALRRAAEEAGAVSYIVKGSSADVIEESVADAGRIARGLRGADGAM